MACRQATSCQQSAAWGMIAARGSIPWLMDKLLYSESLFISFSAYSHYSSELSVGLNQLSPVFYPMVNTAGDDVLDILN
jgi:hypothetical protein